jgi:hypothetical protein
VKERTKQFTCDNLRSAVATAETEFGSTVELGAGSYTLATGRLDVDASLNTFTIAGAGSGQTMIKQTAEARVMNVDSGTLTLSGLTVTGGNSSGVNGSCLESGSASGGGIQNAGT